MSNTADVPRLALHARTVLADARRAIDIAGKVEDTDWRVAFAAAVTLLRAVAHVLHAVDIKKSDVHHRIIQFWWSDVRTAERARIFNEFIRKERDIILKEYEFRFSQEEGRPIRLESGGYLLLESGGRMLTEGVRNKILTGPWSGHSADRLLEDAYEWWLQELTGIEEAIVTGGERPMVRSR